MNAQNLISSYGSSRLLVLFLMLTLSACVTTERGGVSSKKNDEQALAISLQLARSYIIKQQWDMAKRHLKVALDIEPDSPGVREAMALVFQNTGELELADKEYRTALQLDPDYSRGRLNYAAFLFEQKDFSGAIDQLEIVVQDTLYERRDLAYESLGRTYLQVEDYQGAVGAYNRAYLMNKADPNIQFGLATANFQLGDYAEAQKFYEIYRMRVKQQSAQGLWLGIQLADKFENKNAFSSYALALKNLYPTSEEYIFYKESYGGDS